MLPDSRGVNMWEPGTVLHEIWHLRGLIIQFMHTLLLLRMSQYKWWAWWFAVCLSVYFGGRIGMQSCVSSLAKKMPNLCQSGLIFTQGLVHSCHRGIPCRLWCCARPSRVGLAPCTFPDFSHTAVRMGLTSSRSPRKADEEILNKYLHF